MIQIAYVKCIVLVQSQTPFLSMWYSTCMHLAQKKSESGT